jgi:hypothetical protein
MEIILQVDFATSAAAIIEPRAIKGAPPPEGNERAELSDGALERGKHPPEKMIYVLRPICRQRVKPTERRENRSPELGGCIPSRCLAITVTAEVVRKHAPDDHNDQSND